MKKNKSIIVQLSLVLFLVMASFTACKKDFFDINDDPNHPGDVDITVLLPSAEGGIAHVVGNNFQIFGCIWGQYWTQNVSSSQYKTIEQYSPSSNDFDRPWRILYADVLQDLKTIASKATAENKPQYVACAKILQAYTFQLLTDNFGDVPFSQALQAEGGILSPHYDSQQSIYDGIIQLLTDADALIDENDPVHPGADDMLLGGDMALWRAFGNTLKLRVYLRLSEVNLNKAMNGVKALDSTGAVFLGTGEDVFIDYLSEGGNTNPLYSSIVDLGGTQNLVASKTCVDYMNNNNDPRAFVFYSAPFASGAVVGIPQGYYTLPVGTIISLPSGVTGANGTTAVAAESRVAPVKLMTAYESLFLQAEAAARGWLTSVSAQTSYEDAIAESFASYGLTTAESDTFLAQTAIAYPAGTLQDNIKAIITQKWAAMCGNQGVEAWTEWRRTGYPDFFTVSVNSIIGSTSMPQRFFYPSSEVTTNGSFPGQKTITEKVWWDVN